MQDLYQIINNGSLVSKLICIQLYVEIIVMYFGSLNERGGSNWTVYNPTFITRAINLIFCIIYVLSCWVFPQNIHFFLQPINYFWSNFLAF